MNLRRLQITGPSGLPYRLGGIMNVHDGEVLLGTLDPVPVTSDGSEVHIEHFRPANVVRDAQIHIGRLIFLEICQFLAEGFHQVQTVSFAFTRRVDILGGGSQQAAARAETMERIGAVNVTIAPHAMAGHFVVAGCWHYNRENLRALGVVLVEERLRYTKWASQARPAPGVLKGLRSLLVR
ncbi:hypothetical protein [Variovorax sp. Sphag1AA]|uniref:hypothetical protein n=1 Tax=Variovorax sp. Sphag1AA TaxID=2587027 RepID=UPI00160F15E8|nr:hypothetical protein [Variovorax sp. Sphag1AA]MBB3178103.1 glutathione S-transferase [Variovorax sp. Sphag1AA]